MREDLSHLLKRVEDTEDKNDKQALEIQDLKIKLKLKPYKLTRGKCCIN